VRTHNNHLDAIIKQNDSRLPVKKIAEELSEAKAFELEEFLVSFIGRKAHGGPLVNQSDGGRGGPAGRTQSAEERAMRVLAMSNPETRQKIHLAHLGQPSGRKGKKASAETREKLRLSHLGHKHSQETNDKRAASNRGKKRSPEFCARLKTPEARQRMRDGWAKRKIEMEKLRVSKIDH
jgi:hypothetical protein